MSLPSFARRRSLAHGVLLLTTAAPAAAQGVISGLVVDDGNGLALTGVLVRIPSLDRGAVTDQTGRFVLTSVAAGRHTLTTRYLGSQPLSQDVTVENGRTVTVTLRTKVAETTLGAVSVVASRTGQAAAQSQQQNAANVTNVIAADQIGRFPDANIGDALKRVPGITIALDQSEARFGSIRGTEPRFNSVMVNGERVPSAEAEVREVRLDLIPADMVQALEVNKTLTPDMDADAIGGAVNVVTRAAPTGFRMSATTGTGYDFIRNKPVLVGGLVAGNRFFHNRLGIIASASYYDQQFGSDNKEGTWDQAGGRAFMNEFDIRRYDVQRTRQSMSASLDYRFDDDNTITFRSLYNSRDDWENRFRARYILGEPNAQGVQTTEIRRQTKGGGPDDRLEQARLEDRRTQSHQLSGEHLLGGRATLTWSGSIARASESRPDERYIDWRARNVAITPNDADEQNPQFPESIQPSAFTFRRIEQLASFTRDADRNGRIDRLLPLREGDNGTALKFGARDRSKEKLRDTSYNFATPTAAFANLARSGDAQDFTTSRNYAADYRYGTFSTPGFLAGLDLFNPAQFTLEDQPAEYAAGNFDVDEETSRPTTGSQSYTDWLPSFDVR